MSTLERLFATRSARARFSASNHAGSKAQFSLDHRNTTLLLTSCATNTGSQNATINRQKHASVSVYALLDASHNTARSKMEERNILFFTPFLVSRRVVQTTTLIMSVSSGSWIFRCFYTCPIRLLFSCSFFPRSSRSQAKTKWTLQIREGHHQTHWCPRFPWPSNNLSIARMRMDDCATMPPNSWTFSSQKRARILLLPLQQGLQNSEKCRLVHLLQSFAVCVFI